MLINSWKEPIYNRSSRPTTEQDFSRPRSFPYRQHEIHVDEFGYELAPGIWEPQYAAIRFIVDGETVQEQRFPTFNAALRCARRG
jgi:hypothetical protein